MGSYRLNSGSAVKGINHFLVSENDIYAYSKEAKFIKYSNFTAVWSTPFIEYGFILDLDEYILAINDIYNHYSIFDKSSGDVRFKETKFCLYSFQERAQDKFWIHDNMGNSGLYDSTNLKLLWETPRKFQTLSILGNTSIGIEGMTSTLGLSIYAFDTYTGYQFWQTNPTISNDSMHN